MAKNNKKIIIATGGTGGHVFPSISLVNILKNEYEVLITTDKRGTQYMKDFFDVKIKIINSNTIFGKNIFKIFIDIIGLFFSILKSITFIIKSKPSLVIGMGGYSSFPMCLAAYFVKVPILIYENNLVIGRTNRFLLPFAKKILVSNESIKGIKSKYKNKIIFSGYLLRTEIMELRKEDLDINKDKLSILIIGGSQSAKVFSEVLPSIIEQCSQKNIKFNIYQQCREDQIEKLKKTYEKINLEFKLFSFSESLSQYYKKTDIAITRSGASSIAELINLRIPFIAIPLPTSSDNHQFENATYFEKKGYCFLLEEKYIHDKLFKILSELNHNRKKLIILKNRMKEHSDKDSVQKTYIIIKKFLNV